MARPRVIAITDPSALVDDPEPAPAPRGLPRVMAITDQSALVDDPTEAPAKEAPGALEAGLRGLKQGATMGFGDEITAALESAFTDKTYQQARDEARANDKAAKEAHGWVFGAGELGGGLATSLIPAGAIVKGAGAAAHIARGAGAGILQGIGDSEAEDVQGVVQDAAKSGLAGGALGGALGTIGQKLFRGAPARAEGRLLQDITGGRATTAGKKVYQETDKVIGAAKKFGLDKVARDATELAPAAATARKGVGQQIGQVYEEVDRTFMGVKASDVIKALGSVKKRYSAPGEGALRSKLDGLQEEVRTQWGKGARARVPLAKVNEMVGKHEAIGFAGADITPGAGKQLTRDVSHAVNDVLEKRMAEIQEFAGHIKAAPTAMRSAPLAESATAADSLKRLGGLNRDYGALKRIEKVASERAALPPANRAAGGLRNAISKGVEVSSMAASIATGNPLPYLATKVGIPLAKAGARLGDDLLSKLAEAAKLGHSTARLVQQAIEAGIPRAAIAAAVHPASQPEAQAE